jgi:hypothetical protein
MASGNRPLHSRENYSGVSMEIKSLATVAMIENVIYDFCSTGTRIPDCGLQYGRVINSYPSRA